LLAEPGFDFPTEIFLVQKRFADLKRAGDCILVAVDCSCFIGVALLYRAIIAPRTGRTHFIAGVGE